MASARDGAAACDAPQFSTPVRYAVTADEVVLLADADGDGRSDIITSGSHVDPLEAFSVLPNLGDGTFGSERQVPGRPGERLEAALDLTGDGIADLLASNYWQNGITVYRGMSSLQFSAGTAYDTATHGGPSRAVDYDGDGIRDMVSFSFGSGNPVRVHLFRGRGGGQFDSRRTFETAFVVASAPSSRVYEGKVEFVASERSGHLLHLRISADGISSASLDAGPGFDLAAVFADVNGDGLADLVDTNDAGSEGSDDPFEWTFVRMARTDGGFGERRQLMHPRRMSLPTELHAADLDGDGNLDLVVGDFRATVLHYFRGRGNGDFDAPRQIQAGAPVNDLSIGDLNGDRRPDLVTVNNDRSLSVIINAGVPCPPARRRAVSHESG